MKIKKAGFNEPPEPEPVPGEGGDGGAVDELTLIVIICSARPPSPLQFNVYAVVTVGISVSLPLLARLPLQPPEATQLFASVTFQLIVDDCP